MTTSRDSRNPIPTPMLRNQAVERAKRAPAAAVVCLLVALTACRVAPPARVVPPANASHKLGGSGFADRWSYLAGTSGTVTVPAGYCATFVRAHSSSGGSFTIAPDGGPVGSSIAVPVGDPFEYGVPAITGGPDQLGPGTVFVFTSTDSYFVSLNQGCG